jgi:hypothetical protein
MGAVDDDITVSASLVFPSKKSLKSVTIATVDHLTCNHGGKVEL